MRRKITKMSLALVLSFALLLSGMVVNAQSDSLLDELNREADQLLIDVLGYDFIQNHNRAVENAGVIRSSIQRTGFNDIYGGSYIDDNGNLVLLIVEADGVRSDMVEMFEVAYDYMGISVRAVKYSYDDLVRVFQDISMILSNEFNSRIRSNVSSLYVDVFDNRVVVTLREYNQEYVDLFKDTIVDLPMVMLKACTLGNISWGANYLPSEVEDYMTEFSGPIIGRTTLVQGERLYVNGVSRGSVGYGAIRNRDNMRGFVTHGHFLRVGDEISVRRSGSLVRVGIVELQRWGTDSTPPAHNRAPHRFDASFVRLIDSDIHTVGHTRLPIYGEVVRTRGTPPFIITPTVVSNDSRIRALRYELNPVGSRVTADVIWTNHISGARLSSGMSGGPVEFTSDSGIAGVHVAGGGNDGFFSRDDEIRHWNSGFDLRLR